MSKQNKALYIEPIGKSIVAEMMKIQELQKEPLSIIIGIDCDAEIDCARVLALGPDVDISIAVGDTVYYDSAKGTIINTVDPPQIILQPEDIIAREEGNNDK